MNIIKEKIIQNSAMDNNFYFNFSILFLYADGSSSGKY